MNTGVLWIPNGCTVYIGNRLQPAGRHVYFVLCMQGLSGHLGQCLYPRRAYTGVPGMRKTLCAPNGWWQGGHSWTISTAVAMCSTLPKCYNGPFHQKVELQKYKVGSFYQKEEFGRKELPTAPNTMYLSKFFLYFPKLWNIFVDQREEFGRRKNSLLLTFPNSSNTVFRWRPVPPRAKKPCVALATYSDLTS